MLGLGGTQVWRLVKDTNKDSVRLRIPISMTIWAIWKLNLKSSINNQDVSPNETPQILKELMSDLIKKSWNATRFMEEGSKATGHRALQRLWAEDRLTKFDPIKGPTVDFTQRDVAGTTCIGGF